MILWDFYRGSGRGFSRKKNAATITASIGAGLPVLMVVMCGGVPNVIRSSSRHAEMRVIFMQKIVRNDVKLPAQGKQPRKKRSGKGRK